MKETMDDFYKLNKIGAGEEAIVYLVNNRVIKMNQLNGKSLLISEDAQYFTKIQTNRILMPSQTLIDDGTVLSTTCKTYAPNLGVESMLFMTKDDLLEELNILKKDLQTINKKEIQLGDLHPKNISFYYGIYLLDYGGYKFYENEYDEKMTAEINNLAIDNILLNQFLGQIIEKQSDKKTARKVVQRINQEKKKYQCDMFDFFEKDMKKERVLSYSNRKAA